MSSRISSLAYLYVLSAYERMRHGLQVFPLAARRYALRGLALLLLMTAGFSPLFGQQFATLKLTVIDPSGSVIAQAKVSVRNVDTGVIRAADSDKAGIAVMPGLPPANIP
jgi:hypothetical protein